MGEREDERAQADDEHPDAEYTRLVEVRADVGDGDREDDGGDVVAAHDEAAVLTEEGEATFDGRRDDVDEPVHDHALSAQARIALLKRHGPFVTFYFYCKIMLISISYNYCSVLTANKCFIETELTS